MRVFDVELIHPLTLFLCLNAYVNASERRLHYSVQICLKTTLKCSPGELIENEML